MLVKQLAFILLLVKSRSPPTKVGGEGGTNRIAELAEKAGSTLDPVTMDQTLLQSLRQKYQ